MADYGGGDKARVFWRRAFREAFSYNAALVLGAAGTAVMMASAEGLVVVAGWCLGGQWLRE